MDGVDGPGHGDRRHVTRAWNRREKVAKRLTSRRFYAWQRVSERKARVQTDADLVFRLRKCLFGDVTELPHTVDECVVREVGGGDAEAGEHPTGKDALPPEASPA